MNIINTKINCFIVMLVSCMSLLSCTSKEETDFYPSADVAVRLSSNPSTLSVTAKSQQSSVRITSNVHWTATSDAAWCKVETSSGVGNSDITIRVEDNLSIDSRTCTIIVSAENKSVSINVTQSGGALPNVTIDNVTDITRNSAKITGLFSSVFSVREYGVIYSLNDTPNEDGTKIKLSGSESAGKIETVVSNLKSGTTYYICTYATNELGTSYSSVKSFKTLGNIPGEDDNPTPSI